MNRLLRRLNAGLDRLVRPTVELLHRPRSAFHVCGVTGLALAVGLAMTLVVHRGLSPWVMGGIVCSAVATFLALALATKLVVGEERLIYYHHEIAVIVVAGLLLRALGEPVWGYLDATILGVGAFLACGRVGCLMVGCCHGRPHAWGVCYREEHAAAGFASCLVGVRLFPIQAVESVWVLATVAVGTALVLGGAAPGAAFAWYVVVYDIGRFSFEFARGDSLRPYVGGFSEGQWTSLLLLFVVVGLEWSGALPFHAWHAGAAAGMGAAMAAVAVARRLRPAPRHRLLHPRHIREVAEAVERVAPRGRAGAVSMGEEGGLEGVRLAPTSLGLRISAGRVEEAGASVDHYTVSAPGHGLTPEGAGALADLFLRLRHPGGRRELVEGSEGVFHVLIRPG